MRTAKSQEIYEAGFATPKADASVSVLNDLLPCASVEIKMDFRICSISLNPNLEECDLWKWHQEHCVSSFVPQRVWTASRLGEVHLSCVQCVFVCLLNDTEVSIKPYFHDSSVREFWVLTRMSHWYVTWNKKDQDDLCEKAAAHSWLYSCFLKVPLQKH